MAVGYNFFQEKAIGDLSIRTHCIANWRHQVARADDQRPSAGMTTERRVYGGHWRMRWPADSSLNGVRMECARTGHQPDILGPLNRNLIWRVRRVRAAVLMERRGVPGPGPNNSVPRDAVGAVRIGGGRTTRFRLPKIAHQFFRQMRSGGRFGVSRCPNRSNERRWTRCGTCFGFWRLPVGATAAVCGPLAT